MQTSYSGGGSVTGQAVRGMVDDSAIVDVRSFACETSFGLEVGIPAVRGAQPDTVKLPDTITDQFVGVVVWRHPIEDHRLEDGADGTTGALNRDSDYALGETVDVLTRGRIWVVTEETVAAGDPVYWRWQTSLLGSLDPGGWRNDSSGTRGILLPQAKFETGGTAGQLVLLSLNMT